MNENRHRIWDIILRIISIMFTFSVIIAGIYQYNENSKREFRKELYNQQIKVYFETSEIVSRLANFPQKEIPNNIRYNTLREEFFAIKYGKLYFIQDTIVEYAFVEFNNALMRYERLDKNINQEDILTLSLKLNQAFRRSIQNTWDINLPVLKRSEYEVMYK